MVSCYMGSLNKQVKCYYLLCFLIMSRYYMKHSHIIQSN